jgi:hypothetical protein
MQNQSQSDPKISRFPKILHLINFLGAGVFWAIIFISGVDHLLRDSIILFLGILLSIIIYIVLRNNEIFQAIWFSLVIVLIAYIILTENIMFIGRLFPPGFISRIDLSPRLLAYVESRLPKLARKESFEQTGYDPLFYRRVPGSIHRYLYDGNPNNGEFEVIVDESGYLNLNIGYYDLVEQIDVFISGDSVIQGTGMPSLVEEIKKRASFSIWNLSTGSYSPRQKVEALIYYGIPKKPKYLIVEFFSGNDVSEVNEDEICEDSGDFRCRFAIISMEERFLKSKKYQGILRDHFSFFSSIRNDDLCLAVSRTLLMDIKRKINNLFLQDAAHNEKFSPPAYSNFSIQPDKYGKWITIGIENTLGWFTKLVNKVHSLPQQPKIILLYNPSSYEVYRDILIKPVPKYDKYAKMQVEALSQFARDNGIYFISLLPGIRDKIKTKRIWIYGTIDTIHWSPRGTRLAAEVLLEELNKIVNGKSAAKRSPGKP